MEIKKQDRPLVFVTGANGFIASHCIKLLLEKNYRIRGSVRSLKNPINQELYKIHPKAKNNLELVEADLKDIKIWEKVLKNCDMLLHVASPVFLKEPKDHGNVLQSAINGTQNVLEASIKNKIKKVVVTSSVAAVKNIREQKTDYFTNKNFSDEDTTMLYPRSKVLAEKAAWEIYNKNKTKLNLSVICPSIVIDRCLTSRPSKSNTPIKILFKSPLLLNSPLSLVSAKDVALAHIRCLERPEKTRGKRYLLVENTYSMGDLNKIYRDEFGKYGYRFSRYYLPSIFVWFGTFFSSTINFVYSGIGRRMIYDNSNVKEDLDIGFEFHRNYLLRTAYSMIENGELNNKIGEKLPFINKYY